MFDITFICVLAHFLFMLKPVLAYFYALNTLSQNIENCVAQNCCFMRIICFFFLVMPYRTILFCYCIWIVKKRTLSLVYMCILSSDHMFYFVLVFLYYFERECCRFTSSEHGNVLCRWIDFLNSNNKINFMYINNFIFSDKVYLCQIKVINFRHKYIHKVIFTIKIFRSKFYHRILAYFLRKFYFK